MKKATLFLIFVMCLCSANDNAFALSKDYSSLAGIWYAPDIKDNTCKTSDAASATIGTQKSRCTGGVYDVDACDSATSGGQHPSLLMMVAHTIVENGAYFCPTTIHADKAKKRRPYTLYNPAEPGGNSGCIWLCKPGYTGDSCTERALTCDTTEIRRSDYDDYTFGPASESASIENSIGMFYGKVDVKCGERNIADEHDMILAISKWLDSGRGVLAQPFVVRANRVEYKDTWAFPEVYSVGSPTLLCKSGFVSNDAGTDCIAAPGSACEDSENVETPEDAGQSMCDGWSIDEFDPATMEMAYSGSCTTVGESVGGYTFKCTQDGYALNRINSQLTCSECPVSVRVGINPDGECVTCDVGEYFDVDSPNTGYCSETYVFTRQDLQYGTADPNTGNVEAECWTKSTPSEYTECVIRAATPYVRSDATVVYEGVQTVSGTVQTPVRLQPTPVTLSNPTLQPISGVTATSNATAQQMLIN